MTKIITYSLQSNQNNSDAFYKELSHFTDAILPEAYTCFGKTADSFYNYVKDNHTEDCRTKDEYILELVFLGIFLENYLSKARQTQYLPKKVLQLLYLLRKKFLKIKPFIDKLRGVLGYLFLEKQKKTRD